MVLLVQQTTSHGESDQVDSSETPRFSEDLDSTCSTPYVSAPSSPGRGPAPAYFFSAPASPMHFVLYSAPSSVACPTSEYPQHDTFSTFDFDFSSPFSSSGPLGGGSMSSADELFSNGQIKPMKLSSGLEKRQILATLVDHEAEEDDGDSEETNPNDETSKRGRDLKLRSRSVHRKARSLSPLRNAAFQRSEEEECTGELEVNECIYKLQEGYEQRKRNETLPSVETTPSSSASSSRSSSSGRNSKKWIFLKDLLHRSKSEGRGNGKENFWSSISFSPSKEKKLRSSSLIISKDKNPIPSSDENENTTTETQKQKQASAKKTPATGKPLNGVAKRRAPPSAHELHYTTNRAQAEEMKRRTYLPYKQGLFGCLGFSSKGYSALNGLARSLNPVSSG